MPDSQQPFSSNALQRIAYLRGIKLVHTVLSKKFKSLKNIPYIRLIIDAIDQTVVKLAKKVKMKKSNWLAQINLLHRENTLLFKRLYA